jgi:hypothetical protein
MRFAPTAGDDTRKAEGVRAQARVPVPLKANPRTEIAPIVDSARVRPRGVRAQARVPVPLKAKAVGEARSFEAHSGIDCGVDEIS